MDKESLGVFNIANKTETKSNSLSLIINVIIISFLLGLVISLIFMLPSKKQRKKRINELVDDSEYIKA